MMILVGSLAASQQLPNFKRAYSQDLDVWHDEIFVPDAGNGIDPGEMPKNIMDSFEVESKESGVATLNDLLTIKLAHLPYDIFWHKHLNDYLVFKKYGGTVNKPLYEALKEYWKIYHKNKPYLNLYRTKDKFFDDFVKKKFDHDYLHEMVSYPEKPMYTHCLMDGQDVMIDYDKFMKLTFEQQVQMFMEEITVIAYERWVIPSNGNISFFVAYGRSLHKTVTTLTKNWATEFLCENIEMFLKPRIDMTHHIENIIKAEDD